MQIPISSATMFTLSIFHDVNPFAVSAKRFSICQVIAVGIWVPTETIEDKGDHLWTRPCTMPKLFVSVIQNCSTQSDNDWGVRAHTRPTSK